jgi:plastocyanin
MSARQLYGLRLSLILLLVAMLAACNSAPPAPNSPVTTPGIGVAITATDCPSSIVTPGDQVNWTNEDQSEHIVRSESFDSGSLQPGDTFAFVFPQAGRFEYVCSADGASTGVITVEP